jgi:hypothetical protein
MEITKKVVATMGAPYSICYSTVGDERVIVAGSELIGGDFTLYAGKEHKPAHIIEGLGGIMAIINLELGGLSALITAEGLHPNFVTKDAGVTVYCSEKGAVGPWERHRIADFAFIHRIALVTANGKITVIAATLCGKKDGLDDWSSPGAVYAVQLEVSKPPFRVKTEPILEGLRKNHGMFVQRKDGREVVYVSGEEGLFMIHVPTGNGKWIAEKILEEPVSELAVYDLDDDGEDEIVAIQPFHGNTVCIYKKEGGLWKRVFETATELGHGIWAGSIGEKRGFCIYTLDEPWDLMRRVIDRDTGTAQLDVIHEKDRELIVATNNYINEIALYSVTT